MAPFQGPETAKESYDEQFDSIATASRQNGTADQNGTPVPPAERTKVVVVGLGMVRAMTQQPARAILIKAGRYGLH